MQYEEDDIETVRNLLHREGIRHSCKCDECRAIKNVCGLAFEALQMKEARKKTKPIKPQIDWRGGGNV